MERNLFFSTSIYLYSNSLCSSVFIIIKIELYMLNEQFYFNLYLEDNLKKKNINKKSLCTKIPQKCENIFSLYICIFIVYINLYIIFMCYFKTKLFTLRI